MFFSAVLGTDDLEEPLVLPVPVWFPWKQKRQCHYFAEVKCPDAMNTYGKATEKGRRSLRLVLHRACPPVKLQVLHGVPRVTDCRQ